MENEKSTGNKYTVKDAAIIGIFCAVMFVVFMVYSTLTGASLFYSMIFNAAGAALILAPFYVYMCMKVAAPGKSVEQLASEHLEAEQMRFCLAQLTDEERKLISLLFYQEKTEQEIGNMLHISQQSVNKRKQTLLLKMRKIFEEFF